MYDDDYDLSLHEINVRALRTHDEIKEFKWALTVTGKPRDVMLFTLGINTGLRVSDLLPITVGQIKGKSSMRVREKKTKKYRTVYINERLQEDIEQYCRKLSPESYLFASQKGDNSPISTTQAYRVLQKAAKLLERDDIGTHTMRKTFGYMHYQRNKDIATLQTIFNHSSQEITLRYIGITDEEVEKSQEGMYL